MQVNRAQYVDPGYEPNPPPLLWGVEIGQLLKHYTYDALGRLARTQSPHPDPDTAGGLRRSERFYYDGIRRIQEVFVDPVISVQLAQGDPELEALAAATIGSTLLEIDGLTAPAAFEAALTDDDDPGEPEPPTPPAPSNWLDREYVWGPGDRGVDELLIQFNASRAAMPVLQDAGGDCIALCDFGGSGDAARIVAQFTYDPYGQVITHEHLHTHAWLRAGHKGLFVDRLDVGVLTSASENPRLVAGAELLVYNRNRTLKPDLGRFLQQDPNASGLVLVANASHGASHSAALGPFDLEMLFAKGSNLYEYLGASSWTRHDPVGLSWVEDYSGVILPIVGVLDAALPISLLNPLMQLLNGYQLMVQVYAFVQGAAYDAEDELSWALDWGASDDWNPRSRSNVDLGELADAVSGDGFRSIMARGPGIQPNQVALGRRAEGWSRDLHGSVRARRYTSYTDARGKKHRRLLDTTNNDGRGAGHYMEVKSGRQGLTLRVKRQALIDMRLKRTKQEGVEDIRWEFWVRDLKNRDKEVSPELQQFLRDCGIEFTFQQIPVR